MQKKRPFTATMDELIRAGLTEEQLAEYASRPVLGYKLIQHSDLERVINVAGKNFTRLGEIIDFTENTSCIHGIVKKGDIIISIHGCFLSTLNTKKVFIKEDQVYSHLGEFINDGDEVEISFYTENRGERQVDQMGQPRITYKEVRENVKIKFLYEVKDSKLSYKMQRAKLLSYPETIKNKLFNQDHAVDTLFKSIKIFFTNLKEPSKPIGSYLLVGPTGTGKTELAQLTAANLGFSLVRVDMSEFSEKHTISRLIGSPAGYVGYGDKTILEKEIGNEGKKVVLLLDEMEKAHHELQKIFLQAMDNSKITLMNGSEVNFANTLIIMTSNLGTITKSNVGLNGGDKVLSVNMEEVRKHFLPEFMGRLSGVIQFNPLTEAHAELILNKFIDEFNQRTLSEKGTFVNFSKSAKKQLIEQGFNVNYGARPLKNTLQKEIYEKIADLFLFQEDDADVKPNIRVDFIKNEFKVSFEKKMANSNMEVQ